MIRNITHQYPVYEVDSTFVGVIKLSSNEEESELIDVPIKDEPLFKRPKQIDKFNENISVRATYSTKTIQLRKCIVRDSLVHVAERQFAVIYYEVALRELDKQETKTFLSYLCYVTELCRATYMGDVQ